MNALRLLLLATPLLFGWLVFPSAADAATTCSAQMTNLQFGSVDDTGYAATTGTLSWQCDTFEIFRAQSPAHIKLCFAIGAGSASGSSVGSRLMRNPNGDPLSFDISQDPAHSTPWTDSTTPPSSAQASGSYTLSTAIIILITTGNGSGSMPVYARIPAQSLAAGTYEATFSGANARIVYRYGYGSGNVPANCTTGGSGGGSTTITFTTSANVPGLCHISTASDLEFGNNPGTITDNIDGTSAISMQCRNRTAWQVGLDNGMNALGNVRRMRSASGGSYVNYELYRNSSRTTRWGNSRNVDTFTGTGYGEPQTLTVHGRVPAPQSALPGSYSDVVTVTVTY